MRFCTAFYVVLTDGQALQLSGCDTDIVVVYVVKMGGLLNWSSSALYYSCDVH